MEFKLVKSDDPEILVHSWKPGGKPSHNPPSYVPDSYVKKFAKQLQIKPQKMARPHDLVGSTTAGRWKVVEFLARGHPGISIVSDLDMDSLRAVAVYALEFEDMLTRQIGHKRESFIAYRIKIFRSRSDFSRFAESHSAGSAMSFYAPSTRDVGMFFDESLTRDNFQELLAHEITHAYCDLVWGTTSPLWFAEGIAEYFQHFTWERDHAVGGAIAEEQLRTINQTPDGLVPLDAFLKISRGEMYGPNFKLLYAEAWSIVHFLFQYHKDVIFGLLQHSSVRVDGADGKWRGHLLSMLQMV